jgi:hypothetical protein
VQAFEAAAKTVNGTRPIMSVELVHLDAEANVAIIEVPVVAGKEI